MVIERIFNDSFASILTVNNNYPSLIDIDDECAGPLGWANLHVWRFSGDGSNPQEFANTDGFMFSADVTMNGTGDGEAGLSDRPLVVAQRRRSFQRAYARRRSGLLRRPPAVLLVHRRQGRDLRRRARRSA